MRNEITDSTTNAERDALSIRANEAGTFDTFIGKRRIKQRMSEAQARRWLKLQQDKRTRSALRSILGPLAQSVTPAVTEQQAAHALALARARERVAYEVDTPIGEAYGGE